MKRIGNLFRNGLVAALVAAPVWADDSDIYLNSSSATVGIPRVMLSVDLRSNTGGSPCNPLPIGTSSGCYQLMGEELYYEMDLYTADGRRGSDGYADYYQPIEDDFEDSPAWAPGTPYDPADHPDKATVAETYWPDGNEVVLADFIRTVLRVVLQRVHEKVNTDTTIVGIEVGLIVSHEDTCTGQNSGPDQIPSASGNAGQRSGCSDGAYVLQGFTDIADYDNLQDLLQKLSVIPHPGVVPPWRSGNNGWNGHPYSLRDIYLEFYRYITGKRVFNGFLGYEDYKSDIATGNLYQEAADNDVQVPIAYTEDAEPLLSPDLEIMTKARGNTTEIDSESDNDDIRNAAYITPIDETDECSAFYMIHSFFGDTASSPGDTDDALETAAGSGVNAGVGIDFPGGQNDGDVELVATMYDTDFGKSLFGLPNIEGNQNVTSYFLAKESRLGGNNNYIHQMAAQGGSNIAYPLDDPQAALDALTNIFDEILSVSTTFVSASVPVNVYNRAETLDNIYFALFQAEKTPSWNGNVKKLKVAEDPNDETLRTIIQVDGTPAIATDGRIKKDALTFWTDPTGWDVVAFDPNEGEVTETDGRSIQRGGAGQQVEGFLTDEIAVNNATTGARQMYTEDPDESLPQKTTGASPLLALDQDMTDADLAAIRSYLDPNDALGDTDTGTQERKLIGWARGMDAFNADPTAALESRTWLMNDAMHSRPLVINYGNPNDPNDSSNPDIRLYFGTNGGVFHQVKNTNNGSEYGHETFSFIPLELLPLQNTLRENFARSDEPHPYGMDGEAVSFVQEITNDGNIIAADGETVWVYMGMRRGGHGIYAFDVSDPDNPGLMWKIMPDADEFKQLGLSFSTPVATAMDLGEDSLTPVLIFAGGYNGGWNGSDRVGKDLAGIGTDDTVGNAVYIVNAEDGSLIWRAVGPGGGKSDSDNSASLHYVANMTDSIPSAITVIDSNLNDVPDRAYVGDTGGAVWRIELTEANAWPTGEDQEENWYVTKLAQLTDVGDSAAEKDRRFFHAPDFVRTTDGNGDYDGIIITSGDRAHPKETDVVNWAYMIKDRNVTTNNLDPNDVVLSDSNLENITECLSFDPNEPGCGTAGVTDLTKGWKLKLEDTGEKGLSKPLLSNGIIFFTSYLPLGGTPGVCAPSEGEGRVYAVNLSDGTPAFDLSSEVEGTEKADRYTNIGPGIPPDVKPYEGDSVLIPGKGIDGKQIFNVPGTTKWKIYWREEDVDHL